MNNNIARILKEVADSFDRLGPESTIPLVAVAGYNSIVNITINAYPNHHSVSVSEEPL